MLTQQDFDWHMLSGCTISPRERQDAEISSPPQKWEKWSISFSSICPWKCGEGKGTILIKTKPSGACHVRRLNSLWYKEFKMWRASEKILTYQRPYQ